MNAPTCSYKNKKRRISVVYELLQRAKKRITPQQRFHCCRLFQKKIQVRYFYSRNLKIYQLYHKQHRKNTSVHLSSISETETTSAPKNWRVIKNGESVRPSTRWEKGHFHFKYLVKYPKFEFERDFSVLDQRIYLFFFCVFYVQGVK